VKDKTIKCVQCRESTCGRRRMNEEDDGERIYE
jgi:hypothetical protein